MKNMKIKEEKGITLIALAITVVVLLILAGVSLNLVIGNEGILTRSKEAADKYGKQSENEQQGLDDVEEWLSEQFGNIQKVEVDTKAPANGTIDGNKAGINNPIIPEGYTPINVGLAVWGDGTRGPSQEAIDNGLVIKDSDGNQWVWIPVEESAINNIFTTSNKTNGESITGEAEVGETTPIYSNSIIVGRPGDTETITRSTPGTMLFREPDLLGTETRLVYYQSDYDYKEPLNVDGPKQLAQKFVNDYEKMVNSIKKYGGFYIGRYELSNAGLQKDKETLTMVTWYELYKKCTELNASNKVESRMIYGIQWDLACDFISKKGEKKSIKNSNTWGNYANSEAPANTGNYEQDDYGAVKKNTGSNEAWKANNVYDLAGNCWEWTQEAYSDASRVVRGGSCNQYNCSVSEPGGEGYGRIDSRNRSFYTRNSPNTNSKVVLKNICR